MSNPRLASLKPHALWQEQKLDINSLLSSPFDFIIVVDPKGLILSAGENSGKRFYLNCEELLGKCVWDLLPPEVIARRQAFLARVFQTGKAVRFQDERRGHWNDIIIIPIFNGRGQTIKAVVLAYEITRHIIAEEQIKLLSRFPDENPSPVMRINSKGVIIYANKASAMLLETWETTVNRLLPEKIRRLAMQTKKCGIIKEIEERCGAKTLALYLTPIQDSDFLNIYGHDITSRMKAAEALQESQERFRTLVETSHDLIWRCDEHGHFTYLNPAWETTLGYMPEEMLGRHFGEFKPDGITDKDRQIVKDVINGAELYGKETTYVSKTGQQINMIYNVRRLLDAHGKTRGTQGSAHDITYRKQAEKKLQQSEAHYRNLFMNNPAATLEADLSGIGKWLQKLRTEGLDDLSAYLLDNREALQHSEHLIHILDINHSACKMLELKKGRTSADIVPNIFSNNSYALLTGLLLAIWEGKNQFEMEGSGYSSSGAPLEFILQWSSSAQNGTSDLSRGIIALTDITQTKILKKRLLQNEKMTTLGLLVSGISHEINNPNNFIMFNLPILRNYMQTLLPIIDDFSAGKKDFELFGMKYPEFRVDIMALLENMEHGTNRINSTVSRLRDFFAPREKEHLRSTDVSSIIDKSVALCQSQVKKMVHKIDINVPENLPKFYTDPGALEHIIINLMLNAAYAADKVDSWIRLQVQPGKNRYEGLIIEIKDNGCGIEKKDLKKIFEPFYTTQQADHNSGLGMFICYNLTEGLGGRIDLKSKPGSGTTVRVILPEIHQ